MLLTAAIGESGPAGRIVFMTKVTTVTAGATWKQHPTDGMKTGKMILGFHGETKVLTL